MLWRVNALTCESTYTQAGGKAHKGKRGANFLTGMHEFFEKIFSNFEQENFENEFNLVRFSLVLIQNGLI